MRLIKMLGLAAVAAVAAMAFLGASSAMAEFPTTLCSAETTELTCPENKIKLFTMLAVDPVLLTETLDILCEHSVAVAEVEGESLLAEKGEALGVHLEELDFLNCKRVDNEESCTVTVPKKPLLEVLKTAKDLGTVEVNPELQAEINIKCGFFVNCTYSNVKKPLTVESAEHTEGAGRGMLTANKVEVAEGKGFLCPPNGEWDALYQPLVEEEIWLRS